MEALTRVDKLCEKAEKSAAAERGWTRETNDQDPVTVEVDRKTFDAFVAEWEAGYRAGHIDEGPRSDIGLHPEHVSWRGVRVVVKE